MNHPLLMTNHLYKAEPATETKRGAKYARITDDELRRVRNVPKCWIKKEWFKKMADELGRSWQSVSFYYYNKKRKL